VVRFENGTDVNRGTRLWSIHAIIREKHWQSEGNVTSFSEVSVLGVHPVIRHVALRRRL
jgi:hypothetical protein